MTEIDFPEIDCECTHDLICPYCGYVFMDSWEIEESTGEEIECEKCEKFFIYSTEISKTFSSQRADCLNGGEHSFVYHDRETKNCISCGKARKQP